MACKDGFTSLDGKSALVTSGGVTATNGEAGAGDVVRLHANGTATILDPANRADLADYARATGAEVRGESEQIAMPGGSIISSIGSSGSSDLLSLPCPTEQNCGSASVPLYTLLDRTNLPPLKTVAAIESITEFLQVVPGLGTAATLVKITIDVGQGEFSEAGESAIGFIPFGKPFKALKKVRNGHLAGSTHPKTGVPFNSKGFPDFSDHLYKKGKNDVIIKPTGKHGSDFAAANKAAGYKKTPKEYTWHHHQERGRMQLVKSKVHAKTGHTGGFKLW